VFGINIVLSGTVISLIYFAALQKAPAVPETVGVADGIAVFETEVEVATAWVIVGVAFGTTSVESSVAVGQTGT
jgi:hypothetical protein